MVPTVSTLIPCTAAKESSASSMPQARITAYGSPLDATACSALVSTLLGSASLVI